jgi:hypothetical protein
MEIQIFSHTKKFIYFFIKIEFWQLRKNLSQEKDTERRLKGMGQNGRISMMIT